VTAGGGGLTRQVPVVVTSVPSAVVVTPASLRLPQGSNAQLASAVLDAVGDTIPGAALTFLSGNEAIATVSPGGLVGAAGAGTTVLTVTSGDAEATVPVTVVDASILATTALGGRPFGVAVAASGAGYVLQQDLASMARITLPGSQVVTSVMVGMVPTAVAFHPTGATAYVTNQAGGSVSVVDVASNTVTGTIAVGGSPFVVAVAPDGLTLWVTEGSGKVFVVDLGTASVVDTVVVGSAPNGIVFHPADPLVYVSAAGSATVSEINTATNTVVRTFTVGGTPQGIAVALDGSELYIANEVTSLQIWDLVTGLSITTVDLGGDAFGLALSPDGSRLAVTQPGAGNVVLVNRVARTIARTVVTGGIPRRVAFSPDGTRLVVPNEGNWFDLIAN
jgi:YVTN family beta-propeller protein